MRFSCSPKHPDTGTGAHLAPWSLGARVLAHGLHNLVVQFTILLPLMQRLRVSGAIPLLNLYACMPWVETTLPLQKCVLPLNVC